MKLIGLKGVHRRRWRRPRPAAASWPDLVQRKFRAEGPDRLWVTDITQHRTGEGWVYLCAVRDGCSRRVIGWAMDSTQSSALVERALRMAFMLGVSENIRLVVTEPEPPPKLCRECADCDCRECS